MLPNIVNSVGLVFGVYPGFPTLFWGLSVFFVGDLMGKALWKLVENAARFPRRGGRVLCVHGAVSFHRARPCGPRCAFSKARWARSVPRRRQLPNGSQGGGPCVMSSWTAASSDCSRPVNNYVHVKTADLYRPNARLTPERQGYQVLTPFGKLGHSRFLTSSVSLFCFSLSASRAGHEAPALRGAGGGVTGGARPGPRGRRAPAAQCARGGPR